MFERFQAPLALLFGSLQACSLVLGFDDTSKSAPMPAETSFSCAAFEPAPTFCDDFDVKPPRETWSDLDVQPGSASAAIGVDTGSSTSPPNSLVASVSPVAANTYLRAALLQLFSDFTNEPFRARIEFDLRVEQFDPNADARVVAFQFLFGEQKTGYNQLVLNLDSRETAVVSEFSEVLGTETTSESRGAGSHPVPPLNEWTHVSFELEVFNPSGGGNNARLTVGDTTLFDQALGYDLAAGTPRLELGLPWVDTSAATGGGWRVRFDNVYVQLDAR